MSDLRAIDMTPDRQSNQTMAVTHFVMKALDEYIPRDLQKYATRALFDALQEAGVDIITNENRIEAGLPPRGPKGWTDWELKVLDLKRQEAMLAPMQPLILPQR